MIVELRRPEPDRLAYTTVARLTVYDDDSWAATGATDLFDTAVPVREPGQGHIQFVNNPAGWARNLPNLHRTAYLTAVVVSDASDMR